MEDANKTDETVVDREIGHKPYRQRKWQSNLTILSCVGETPPTTNIRI
jgi:hypothetical protein